MNDPVRVLLVGAGRAGLVHARNLAAGVAGAELVAVADPDEQAARDAADELGVGRVRSDPAAAVTDDGVDAVVVAAPTFAHAEVVVPALEAGRHVMSEKPLAPDLEAGARIREAVEAADGAFLMAFMRRFDPRFERAAERIVAGDIGEPVLVKSNTRGPGLPPPWAWDTARSGGLVAEVNSHDLDTVRWLSGQEITSVHCLGRAAKRPDLAAEHDGFVDVLTASLELDGGGLASIDGACPADYGYDARTEVYGTEGALFVGRATEDAPLLVRDGTGTTDLVRSWRGLFADAYRAEDEHFVAVARGEAAPRVTVADAVAALEAVVAANRSMAEGRPVALAEVRGDGAAAA